MGKEQWLAPLSGADAVARLELRWSLLLWLKGACWPLAKMEGSHFYEVSRPGKCKLVIARGWGWWGLWEVIAKGYRVSFGVTVLILCWWLHDFVNTLKTLEPYTLDGWIVWCVNYTIIKLLTKKKWRIDVAGCRLHNSLLPPLIPQLKPKDFHFHI